ncbi:hypothetical protein FRC08_012525 [Ceratobasidium sp. 394]|nr:hypothetical protein FRC08_012525 [Ceratobasidium sp. 394]
MTDRVVQLHGSNTCLKCSTCKGQPKEAASVFDQPLIVDGAALCPSCRSTPSGSNVIAVPSGKHLEGLPAGYLFPDIQLDDQKTELWAGNDCIDKFLSQDADCDVLLLLSPRLASKGVVRMLKALADKVHQNRGIVIYIDWKTVNPSVWARYFDLHLEVDPDMWANTYLADATQVQCDPIQTSRAYIERKANILSLANQLKPVPAKGEAALPQGKKRAGSSNLVDDGPRKKITFAPGTKLGDGKVS